MASVATTENRPVLQNEQDIQRVVQNIQIVMNNLFAVLLRALHDSQIQVKRDTFETQQESGKASKILANDHAKSKEDLDKIQRFGSLIGGLCMILPMVVQTVPTDLTHQHDALKNALPFLQGILDKIDPATFGETIKKGGNWIAQSGGKMAENVNSVRAQTVQMENQSSVAKDTHAVEQMRTRQQTNQESDRSLSEAEFSTRQNALKAIERAQPKSSE